MIKVYSTSSCPWCTVAKNYLNSIGVSFEDYNVAEDWNAAKEMIQKSGQRGVPVLDINGDIVVGFDKERIDVLLKGSN